YCTARSCFSAAPRESNVPRFRRLPVLGFSLREYSRYSPDFSLRIIMHLESRLRIPQNLTFRGAPRAALVIASESRLHGPITIDSAIKSRAKVNDGSKSALCLIPGTRNAVNLILYSGHRPIPGRIEIMP